MLALFRKRNTEGRRLAEAVKARVRTALSLGDDTAISVNEIQCGDVACPGTETVILVMQPGRRTLAYRIVVPLASVDQAAIDKALAAGGA
jgi:hypothetical protein